ncbi:MAG: hypothetical protein EZS28_021917, partial [Streblomastix strix]
PFQTTPIVQWDEFRFKPIDDRERAAKQQDQAKTPKSSLNKQSCIKTMIQFITDREPMHDTPSALTCRAISKCNILVRKYTHVWHIDILFNHGTAQPADQIIIEVSEIDLNLSNFNFGNSITQLILSPRTINALEQYEVRRTGILNLCLNVTLFTSLERLREHFHQEITTVASLFWTEQWKPVSVAKISELLSLLINRIGLEGFTAYSIKHASTTKLAEMGTQERDLNIFKNQAPDSKSAHNNYVFAANKQVNGITERLVTINYGLQNQDSTSMNVSQQKRKNVAPNGDIHILSMTGGDSMLQSFGTAFLPPFNPEFLPNPSSERKIQTNKANATNNPFQTTPIVQWDEFRFKPIDDRERAAKQQDQAKTPKTNHFTSLHDSSYGSPLRKPKLTPAQSQMIKDLPCLGAKIQRK